MVTRSELIDRVEYALGFARGMISPAVPGEASTEQPSTSENNWLLELCDATERLLDHLPRPLGRGLHPEELKTMLTTLTTPQELMAALEQGTAVYRQRIEAALADPDFKRRPIAVQGKLLEASGMIRLALKGVHANLETLEEALAEIDTVLSNAGN
jgi:hypothetical protein